jgi:menaquinone-dependent protoporphyrinogen oxidase
MSARILVAYLSRKGSTDEIAKTVGKELQSTGYSVDVVDMKSVPVCIHIQQYCPR